nr:hypothetical protein [Nostoc flagelliforme]
MRWWRDQNPDARFLNNGHRVNLLKNLGSRLQTAMYSDLGYTGLAIAQALSITIDSLHKLNTQALKYGCIFIDEACQYLVHLLHSNTCKEHRAAILEVPPKLVTDKDRAEREKLLLCMDWGNYSARWLARFNLGLHHILERLVAGGEVNANNPDLIKMTAIAKNCPAHVKAILGFTIPSDCKPIWLLATMVEQLGLKLTSRKQGKRGQQVKIYSLSKSELEFAKHVIAHRQNKREQKAPIRNSQLTSRNCELVSTPPHDCIGKPHDQGGDTTEFDPPPTDRTTLLHCVEMLRVGIKHGVDAIKGILKGWVEDLRSSTVLELEAIAPDELRLVEAQVPEFYALLNEEVLPMEG